MKFSSEFGAGSYKEIPWELSCPHTFPTPHPFSSYPCLTSMGWDCIDLRAPFLWCFLHFVACKDGRIPTLLPLAQHARARAALHARPDVQPAHTRQWKVCEAQKKEEEEERNTQITRSQSHDTDKRRTRRSGSFLPESKSDEAPACARKQKIKVKDNAFI